MGHYFVDTSALVKRYRPERGTNVVDALFEDTGSVLLISRLGIIETISALALKVRSGELQHPDYMLARKRFLGDIGHGALKTVRLLAAHYRGAEQLINRHATSRHFRTLDALQLTVALDLHEKGYMDAFVCADQPLCEVAALENVAVVNPLAVP